MGISFLEQIALLHWCCFVGGNSNFWLYVSFWSFFFSFWKFSGCYPFTDRDPFVLESCPHVYFVGNQDVYESRLLKGNPWIVYNFFSNNTWSFLCQLTLLFYISLSIFLHAGSEGQMARIVTIPKFCDTGVAVVVILKSRCYYSKLYSNLFAVVSAV